MSAEIRTALAMAQRLDSTTSFYDNMRLQHRTVVEAVTGSQEGPPKKTYQGDGRRVFRTYIDHLATVEIERTRLILNESVGWVLMFDGMNKGKYSSKGEMVMGREVSAEGVIRVRCMHLLFLRNDDLVKYRRVQVKPFGATAQWERMRDASQSRYCQGERPPGADYLPSVFRNLLQISTDGASVMHTFQNYIRDTFIEDLIPGIDDPHQLERCLVHALRDQPYALQVLDCVRLVVKTFRKKELLSMQLKIDHEAGQSLKVIHPGRWSEGLFQALSAILDNYAAMAPLLRETLRARKGAAWARVSSMWFTTRFLEMVAGLVDITQVLKRAQKELQNKTINYTSCDSIHTTLRQELKEPVGTRVAFAAVKHHRQRTPTGQTLYKGVLILNNNSAVELLRSIKTEVLAQHKVRFSNRGILERLKWLDLRMWPSEDDAAAVATFAVADIEALFNHWKGRLARWEVTLEALKAELVLLKSCWKTVQKPIADSLDFWRRVICNRGDFPKMHFLLRMVLALTPSDAVVESAFSRLTKILTDQRMRISTGLLEQLLFLAIDSVPWEEYDVTEVAKRVRTNGRREPFRLERVDRQGVVGRKRSRRAMSGSGAKPLTADSESSSESDTSSQSSGSESSGSAAE